MEITELLEMKKAYRLAFTRGLGGVVLLTIFSLTVVLIPIAIIMLIESIEIREIDGQHE